MDIGSLLGWLKTMNDICQAILNSELILSSTYPGLSSQNSIVQMALPCLESAWNTAKEGPRGSHSYTKALLAYAFALVGNQNRRREILNSLDEEAVKEGESKWLKKNFPFHLNKFCKEEYIPAESNKLCL